MNLEKLHNVISMLDIAGIKQANIIKEDGTIKIFGADDVEEGEEQPSIVVISTTDSNLIDASMGVQRVPTMLKRMNLFDTEKMKQTHTISEEHGFMNNIIFKEGRRKASYTFADPHTINVPTGAIEDEIIFKTSFTKDYIDRLGKANSAMGSKFLTLNVINNEVILELYDDISDTFTDVIGNFDGGDWSYNWKTNSVLRLLRHAVKTEDEVSIEVGEVGILYITISEIDFMIMPYLQ